MAPQLDRALRRLRSSAAQASATETRHPAVALAIAVPFAVLLLALFGGWEQLATQTRAVADLIGR
ncbi:hypothetical protein GCM10010441_52640 [Kitasatospora paracochleata]|uniref:Uncharacterized protein n=1 Tax=Kitasatospora paracochleata TaxID=58354 RepID=A0ABT1IUL1_9ACTN|nr:hypothetical protein [Kitasatospora paracochleata]MCP2308830.1 hypothetical protein [Kitasatospora paracochleata]